MAGYEPAELPILYPAIYINGRISENSRFLAENAGFEPATFNLQD